MRHLLPFLAASSLLLACSAEIDLARQGASGSSGTSGQSGAAGAGPGGAGPGGAGQGGAGQAGQAGEGAGGQPQAGQGGAGQGGQAGSASCGDDCPPVEDCKGTRGDLFTFCQPGGEFDPACPVEVDLAVRCAGDHFAQGGVRVAPSPGALHLGAVGRGPVRLLTATGAGVATVAGTTLRVDGSPFALLVDADGRPRLAGDETVVVEDGNGGIGFSGGLAHEAQRADQSFARTAVLSKTDLLPLVDFALSPDGRSQLWFRSAEASHAQATVDPATGQVTIAAVPSLGTFGYHRYTLDGSGQTVSLGLSPANGGGSGFQLLTLAGAMQGSLGAPYAPRSAAAFDLAAPPIAPLPAGQPAYAALLASGTQLSVAWPTAQTPGYQETALPGTEAPPYTCPLSVEPTGDACPAPCQEVSSGVEAGMYAAARTDDGDVWVAYVVSSYDQPMAYSKQSFDGVTTCVAARPDTPDSVLHVVRVRLDGSAPVEKLAWPLQAAATRDVPERARALDVRASGAALAIAARLQVASDDPLVRLIRLDTSRFAP